MRCWRTSHEGGRWAWSPVDLRVHRGHASSPAGLGLKEPSEPVECNTRGWWRWLHMLSLLRRLTLIVGVGVDRIASRTVAQRIMRLDQQRVTQQAAAVLPHTFDDVTLHCPRHRSQRPQRWPGARRKPVSSTSPVTLHRPIPSHERGSAWSRCPPRHLPPFQPECAMLCGASPTDHLAQVVWMVSTLRPADWLSVAGHRQDCRRSHGPDAQQRQHFAGGSAARTSIQLRLRLRQRGSTAGFGLVASVVGPPSAAANLRR